VSREYASSRDNDVDNKPMSHASGYQPLLFICMFTFASIMQVLRSYRDICVLT
jgi:hypothetical protein